MSLFSDKKNETVLVFDIGSSSVGVVIFEKDSSEKPRILHSLREDVKLEDKIDFNRFLTLTMEALARAADSMFRKKIGAPAQIFCVLSSPWYMSQTRVIKLEENEPFVFTSKLADSLIKKEIDLFEQEYMSQYLDSKGKLRLLDFKNIKTTLNGYSTREPLDQKAKALEMTVFISVSQEQILEKIEQTIVKYFHNKRVNFSSFVLSSFAVIRDLFAHQENFLLMDVSGEVTDISLVKNHTLMESVSFPMGCSYIIRGAASHLNCSLEETKSFLSLYRDNHAAGPLNKRLEEALDSLKKEWMKKFQESLAGFSSDIFIPSTIFMTIDDDFFDLFSQIIKTEQFSQYSLTDSKFTVNFVGTRELHGLATFEENVVRDPFLIIESIYINRFIK